MIPPVRQTLNPSDARMDAKRICIFMSLADIAAIYTFSASVDVMMRAVAGASETAQSASADSHFCHQL